MVEINLRSNQEYEVMSNSEKDVNHDIRLHCSIQRILTECQVCSSRSSVAEDTAPVELTCRKGGVTVSSEVRGKYHKCDKSYEE